MAMVESIVLGIIQGVTEFLPISSSGHLLITREWLGFAVSNGLAFDVTLHWGTLVAVVIIFRRDLWALLQAWLRSIRSWQLNDPQARVAWCIILATIPAGLAGLFLGDWIDDVFRSTAVVIVTLAIGAVAMIVAERWARPRKTLMDVTFRASLLIGLAQAVALVPGVSRSGATIITAFLLGFQRHEAARFSFLLSVPVIFLAGISEIPDFLDQSSLGHEWGLYLGGFVASLVSGYLAIRFLLQFLRQHRLTIFAVYRLALAIALLII